MKASEALKSEHQAIERVLEVLEKVTDRLEAGKIVSTEVLEDSLDFLDNFVDRRHHAKEERALFPALVSAGGPEVRDLVVEMIAEHEDGRGYLRALAKTMEPHRRGDEKAVSSLVDNSRHYVALLTQHIRKEDEILFPMADRLLSDADQQELVAKFDRMESEHLGTGVYERYHQMIDSLAEKVRVMTHSES